MQFLKAVPELVVEYFNFLIRFASGPRKAMDPYLPSPDEPNAISEKLAVFAAFAVGLSYVISTIGHAIGMAPDSSKFLEVLGRVDQNVLPFALLVTVILVSIVAHIVLRGSTLVAGWFLGSGVFIGPVFSTVNAGLAFAAYVIPAFTILIVGLRVLDANMDLPVFVSLLMIPFGLSIWVYMDAAFAAAHRLPFGKAWLFISTIIVVLFVIIDSVID